MSVFLEEKKFRYEIEVRRLNNSLIEEINAFIKTQQDVVKSDFTEAKLYIEISNLDKELALETKKIIEDFIKFIGAN